MPKPIKKLIINNYYREYKIIPNEWWDKLHQGKVLIKNWHQLMWETEKKQQTE